MFSYTELRVEQATGGLNAPLQGSVFSANSLSCLCYVSFAQNRDTAWISVELESPHRRDAYGPSSFSSLRLNVQPSMAH